MYQVCYTKEFKGRYSLQGLDLLLLLIIVKIFLQQTYFSISLFKTILGDLNRLFRTHLITYFADPLFQRQSITSRSTPNAHTRLSRIWARIHRNWRIGKLLLRQAPAVVFTTIAGKPSASSTTSCTQGRAIKATLLGWVALDS